MIFETKMVTFKCKQPVKHLFSEEKKTKGSLLEMQKFLLDNLPTFRQR